jgi:hypothetical protein
MHIFGKDPLISGALQAHFIQSNRPKKTNNTLNFRERSMTALPILVTI